MAYVITFLEGIITFISPCLLPMLPLYVTYIAGPKSQRKKHSTLKASLGFVLGFTITFILMGLFAGTIGKFIIRYNSIINIISGAIIILFGLSYLGIFNLKLFEKTRKINWVQEKTGFLSSTLFGMIFSIGWTPCVGTFLGSALVMAANSGSATKGMLMLLAYALGLGIPFILSGVLIEQLKSTFDFIKRNYKVINAISGIILILIGLLMMSGMYGILLAKLSF